MKMRMILTAFLCLLATTTVASAGADRANVLILTGSNNHQWKDTTPALKTILEETGRFHVDVILDPQQLSEEKLAKYDVLLSNWNNWVGGTKEAPAAWSPTIRKAYVEFVKKGGGHVMIHAGSSSFFDWEDYQNICCATWKLGQTGHGPQHEFEVRMTAVEHPVTKGLSGFKTRDELWQRPGVQPGVQVLAEAYSSATKNWEPSAMVNQFGKGRCFALMLGHGTEHMQTDGFKALLIRGTAWAACRPVAD